VLARFSLTLVAAVVCISAGTAANSTNIEALQWVDLEPAATDTADPFAELPPNKTIPVRRVDYRLKDRSKKHKTRQPFLVSGFGLIDQ
jgi:hypothetical protein